MAIKIEFLSDIKDLLKGTKKVGDELEDISDGLEDVGKAGDKSGDQLGDSFKSVGKGLDAAGDEVQTFESKAAQAFKAVGDDAKKSGKAVGDSQKEGLDKAGAGLDDFKSEAAGTARETAASFDGSADSIAGSFQEVAANALGGFGPAGAAAGLALAAGMGIAISALQGASDEANETGEQVSALAAEIRAVDGDLSKVDFNSRMEEWGLGIQDTKEWFEIFQDTAKTGLDDIREKAEKAGVGWVEAFKGTKGTMEDSEAALDRVDAALEQARDSAQKYVDAASGMEYTDFADQERINALEDLKKGYQENITVQERAAEANRLLEEAGVKTEEQLEREEAALEAVNDELTTHASKLAEAAGAAVSADKAELDYVATLNQASEDIASNGRNIDINTAAGRANRETLIGMADSANSVIQAQITQGGSTAEVTAKTEAARSAFIKAAEAAGYGATEAQELATRYGLVPKDVETRVKAHGVEEARKWPDTIPNSKPVSVEVKVNESQSTLERYLSNFYNRKIPVEFQARAGTPALP